MSAAVDFNYKVALASGLRELQAGRLERAEEQFRYLCAKFPGADGGYRGLAKVQLGRGDRSAALATLRDGGAKLARAGDHGAVVALLSEALQLEPLDVAAHRRLAAAHALAGEADAAAEEYVRFSRASRDRGDDRVAEREARYALDTLGPHPALVSLARDIGVDFERLLGAGPEPRAATRPAAPSPARPSDDDIRLGAIPGLPRRKRLAPQAEPEALAPEPPAAEVAAAEPAEAEPEPVGAAPRVEVSRPPAEMPLEDLDDPNAADMRAAEYIATRDPRAAQAALVAARHFIAAGQTNAASDLLLQLIASGLADHNAQRLLVDVVSAIGKRDVARAKCTLLAEALRLDGQADLALEVERLAQAV